MQARTWRECIGEFVQANASGGYIGGGTITLIARTERSPAILALCHYADDLDSMGAEVRIMLVESPESGSKHFPGVLQKSMRRVPAEVGGVFDERWNYACIGDLIVAGGTESEIPVLSTATPKARQMNQFVSDLIWAQSAPLFPEAVGRHETRGDSHAASHRRVASSR